jgi:acetyl-CoA carboxylase alpha subunit
VIDRALNELSTMTGAELVNDRYEKFRRMGSFFSE